MPVSARFKTLGYAVLIAAVAQATPRQASASLVYATSITTDQIYSVDTATHVVTPVFNTGAALDSIFFDPGGRLVYSELDAGKVLAYDPTTKTNVVLASGLRAPIDLALEPGLTTLLVSDSTSHLNRISLAGGLLGSLNVGSRPDGVTYDTSGRLFVNVSTGFTANDSKVEQIDPTTGAVIHSTGNTGVFLDGLTYDSFTGKLYASDYNNGRIAVIDPNTFSFTFLTPSGSSLNQPDGITSDGLGNLYIASRGNSSVMQYNIATNTDTVIGTIAGLDDLAPASGLGAIPTPEPSTLVVAGTGALAGLAYASRRRKPSST